MGTYAKFCAEVRDTDKWSLNVKEVFPFPEDAWQRSAGDNRKLWEFPFASKSYALFAFFAGVRNEADCQQLAEVRGLPEDVSMDTMEIFVPRPWWITNYGEDREAETVEEILSLDNNMYGFSWLTLSELLQFDYDKKLLDISELPYRSTSYREFLGEEYFSNVAALKQLGKSDDVRIVFGFD